MPFTQIALAWTAAHAGLRGVLALATLVMTGALVAAWLGFSRGTIARVCTLPLVAGLVWLQRDDLCARGQVFGDAAFVALLLLLDRADQGRRVPWIAPTVLGALWANAHPSFLLVAVLPAALAAAGLADRSGRRASPWPPLRIAAFASAGTLINPYGYGLIVDVARLARSPSTARIDLFVSPDFHDPRWVALMGVAGGVFTLRARHGPVAGRARDALVTVLLAGAACWGRRYCEILGFWSLAQAGRLATREAVRLEERAASLGWRLAGPVTIALGSAAAAVATPKDPLAQVPDGAAEFVEREHLPDHVFGPYHWGGYLEWAWAGRRQVFVDGRNNLFDNGVFDDAHTIWRAQEGWARLLDAYHVETVLAERGSVLDAALWTSGWRRVFLGRLAVVYLRRSI